MSIWEQIIKDYAGAPKVSKKAGVVPDTHKRCSLCKKVKSRDEFYKKPGDNTNSVTSKCKPCHIAYNNQKEREQRQLRAEAREKRNKELAEKAKQWSK
jgi:hypothetical protein